MDYSKPLRTETAPRLPPSHTGTSKINVLYYSKHCAHSQRILAFLVKQGLTEGLSCICIDKRQLSPHQQWIVQLENGGQHPLPPNIDRVPALLLVSEKHQVRFGGSILEYFAPSAQAKTEVAQQGNGEPLAFDNGSTQAFSAYV